jgi:hypothetical protein
MNSACQTRFRIECSSSINAQQVLPTFVRNTAIPLPSEIAVNTTEISANTNTRINFE